MEKFYNSSSVLGQPYEQKQFLSLKQCNFKATRELPFLHKVRKNIIPKLLMARFPSNIAPIGFCGRSFAGCGTTGFILKSGFPSYAANSS